MCDGLVMKRWARVMRNEERESDEVEVLSLTRGKRFPHQRVCFTHFSNFTFTLLRNFQSSTSFLCAKACRVSSYQNAQFPPNSRQAQREPVVSRLSMDASSLLK